MLCNIHTVGVDATSFCGLVHRSGVAHVEGLLIELRAVKECLVVTKINIGGAPLPIMEQLGVELVGIEIDRVSGDVEALDVHAPDETDGGSGETGSCAMARSIAR